METIGEIPSTPPSPVPFFASTSSSIQYGDRIIVYVGYRDMQVVDVEPGNDVQCAYGHYRVDDFVGKPFGSKVAAMSGRGYVHLLRPVPELWTLSLRHRTQILYTPDISMVIMKLRIRPGCIVVESGTGSGSLTTALARAVYPTGRVHSHEFNEKRYQIAKDEFERNGFGGCVSLNLRDVISAGFCVEDGSADAVFLDLPAPWDAVDHAKRVLFMHLFHDFCDFSPNSIASCEALRVGGRLCSFSPCLEQVLQASEKLRERDFVDIHTYEVLWREHDLKWNLVGTLDLERIASLHRDLDQRSKSFLEIVRARKTGLTEEENSSSPSSSSLVTTSAPIDDASANPSDLANSFDDVEYSDHEAMQTSTSENTGGSVAPVLQPPLKRRKFLNSSRKTEWPGIEREQVEVVTMPNMKGHTGFLTFARLPVL